MEGREERTRGEWSAGGVPTPPLGGESNNSQKHINLNTLKYNSDEQGVDGGTFIALLFLFRCLANETKYTSLQLLGDRHENGLLLLLASCVISIDLDELDTMMTLPKSKYKPKCLPTLLLRIHDPSYIYTDRALLVCGTRSPF